MKKQQGSYYTLYQIHLQRHNYSLLRVTIGKKEVSLVLFTEDTEFIVFAEEGFFLIKVIFTYAAIEH